MNKAVFLDRDGVINPLRYYPDWNEYESPRIPEDFEIYHFVPTALKLLKDAGYYIFVISNQPSYAKGKTSLKDIKAIEKVLEEFSSVNGGLIDDNYYCYHHPDAVVKDYAIQCGCRKPGTMFPEKALQKYRLDAENCYFIGDQDSDIFCGEAMGFSTIKINNPHSSNKSGRSNPDYFADNLLEAVLLICRKERAVYELQRVH